MWLKGRVTTSLDTVLLLQPRAIPHGNPRCGAGDFQSSNTITAQELRDWQAQLEVYITSTKPGIAWLERQERR